MRRTSRRRFGDERFETREEVMAPLDEVKVREVAKEIKSAALQKEPEAVSLVANNTGPKTLCCATRCWPPASN